MNTSFIHTQVHTPNRFMIGSAVFAKFTSVTNSYAPRTMHMQSTLFYYLLLTTTTATAATTTTILPRYHRFTAICPGLPG